MFEKINDDILTVGGKEIKTQVGMIDHSILKFYPENPRIYSIACIDSDSPDQEEIQEKLIKMDHVKQLKLSIEANGGLIDPIIVRDGDFFVFEGNSRLAAYRSLSQGDIKKWSKIKCTLLPKETADDIIGPLLGQYHIIGKKDWAPYEQAGYLWRRHKHQKVSLEAMENEIGLSKRSIEKLVDVYDFMVAQDDGNLQHWSYYDEYLKSRTISKARAEYPNLDKIIVAKIKSSEIAKAIDIRTQLNKICATPKALKQFANGTKDFDEAHEIALHKGAGNEILKSLYKFKNEICDPDYIGDFNSMPKEHIERCIYELSKIHRQITKLLPKKNQE